MKVKNCPHVNYKYYRRFKPLIRKEMNLLIIHNYVFAFTMLCCAVGFFVDFVEILDYQNFSLIALM